MTRSLWLSNEDGPPPSPGREEIVRRAEAFQRRLRFHDAMEYAAGAFVIVVFMLMAAGASDLPFVTRIGAAAIACGCVFVLTYLRLRGAAARETPRGASTFDFHRSELGRRRDLCRRVPIWYIGPFVPGMVLFLVGVWMKAAGKPGAIPTLIFVTLCVVAVNVSIALLNVRAAKNLDAEIDALGDRSRHQV